MFVATVYRKEIEGQESAGESIPKISQKTSQKASQKIIELMKNDPMITIADLAQLIGITERAVKMQIKKMKARDQIQRVGPDKGGRWQVDLK